MISYRNWRTNAITGTILAATAVLLLALAASARADLTFDSVGFDLSKGDQFSRQAGAHADFTTEFSFPVNADLVVGGQPSPGPEESVHSVDVDLPPGLVGDPNGIATCDPRDFAVPGTGQALCPLASQVGYAEVEIAGAVGPLSPLVGVFNLAHGPDVPARFGFNYLGTVALIEPRVRPGDYGVSAGTAAVSQALTVQAVKITLWGVPSDSSHDAYRGGIVVPSAPPVSLPDVPHVPFLSSPTYCPSAPSSFTVRADSWQNLGAFDIRTTTTDSDGTPFVFRDCDSLPFSPSVDAAPSTRVAGAPTGLSVELEVPQSEEPNGRATSHVRDVKMTLPEGMSVSSSSAAGLGACSLSEIGLGSNAAPSCPPSSKIGTVRIETPLLAEELEGDVILAKQNDNPFNSLLAMYIAVKGPGFYLKLPGKVTPDPNTGQLTVTFANNPQLPFERLRLNLIDGPRAPLANPSACGTYTVKTTVTPWSGTAPVELNTPIKVDQGCSTGGFDPKLNAGTVDPTGGAFSPFVLQVIRNDGETNLARLNATLPPGLLAKLAGVTLCGDAQAATGDCPAGSQVGQVTVGSGSGPLPVYVPEPGKAPTAAYLAGPYKGAPYSMVVKVPAQAGPFDLGTVTVRNALNIDPTTAQVTAVSDPLPQILQGIPIAYRDVRVEVNRPNFTINPTSCKEMKVTSVLTSATGQTATPSAPFSASGCGELGFKPSLKLSFKGKMNRTGNPAVSAVLKAGKGEANIAKTTVILPKSQFIDNAHINNPCTRVQFNANACPASSILGQATAYTPLLDQPLSGPVYFRSNGGERELPDLVADLNGQIHVTLVGFIDSVKAGKESSMVRTRFQNVPDAPVSKFVLKLKGGKKGLIENSENLCSFTPRAKVQMTGQNGKPNNFTAKIGTSCGKKERKK
jgi:hypothetical protein